MEQLNYKKLYEVINDMPIVKLAIKLKIEQIPAEIKNNILYRETDKFIFITFFYLDNKIIPTTTCWGCAETKAFPSEEWLNIHDACKDGL